MDFGIQKSWWARFITSISRWIEPIGENLKGHIPQYMRDTGFIDVAEKASFNTSFGSVSIYRGRKQEECSSSKQ